MATSGSSTPKPSRKGKLAAGVGGVLALFAVIGSLGSHSTQTSPASDAHAAATSTSAPRTVEQLRATTPSPATSSTPTAPPPPAPVLAMTCPTGGTNASPLFGNQITATAPYTVVIDYGDGDAYTNDDQHLGAIFSHTYSAAGSFPVHARVTDATGRSADASCTYSWTAPPPPVVRSNSGTSSGSTSGGSTSTSDTTGDDSGTSSSGSSSAAVHPGAFCSPEGDTGYTSAGTLMVCSTKPGDSRARWRSA